MSLPAATAYDLIVIGSGAGGLSAAVVAAHLGLKVLVLEKEAQFGGTTAWSGGWMWVPRNPLAVAAGIVEAEAAPLEYLRGELCNGFDETLIRRFLDQAPRMVSFFQAHSALAFIDGNRIPDFHAEQPGGARGGRSVCAAPFDGRRLGARLKDLKPPLDLVAPFGMGIGSGADLGHFLNATRKAHSFLHASKRMARHFGQRILHGRGTHLVNGNALVAALLKSADDLGVTLLSPCQATGLLTEGQRVVGVKAKLQGADHEFFASRGVVLAAGGFPHDTARQAEMFDHSHHSAAPLSNAGDGLRLGEQAGGAVRRDFANAGAWAPVSLVPQAGGKVGRFPHLVERAKPGLIMVRRNGRRFTNEANSYHDVMQALFAATPKGEQPECWMLCDHRFIRRYGLGRVRPRPFPLSPWLDNGYLARGHAVAELARRCGVDEAGLTQTIADFNTQAAQGKDPQFHRGETAYNRIQGEATQKPNPCVAPLVQAPFYAVKIVPGSLGTFAGLACNADAQVLDAARRPIAGLYAVGNDMASIMAGRYPAGGITLGPAMTFGYIAAHHAAGRKR